MKKNMGRLDRTIRLVVALVFILLVIARVAKGTAAIVLVILAAIFVLDDLAGILPALCAARGFDEGIRKERRDAADRRLNRAIGRGGPGH